ncbi:MAG: hypothetical protein ACXWQZ_23465, partial [Ktedonobacterales bacterium]
MMRPLPRIVRVPLPRGLSVERVRQQRQLIEQLNVRYAPFRVLHGTEVDILASGDLDYLED